MVAPGAFLREEITAGVAIPVADAQDQTARILDSEAFRHSDTLKAILSFVTSEAIKGNLAAVKEYTIATEVLGHPADFDGRTSNLVRVHANRLRQRLQLYYAGQGQQDPVIICLPKGSYVPHFSRRAPGGAVSPPAKAVERRPWIAAAGLVLAGLLAGLAPFAVYLWRWSPAAVAHRSSSVYRLWKPFVEGSTPPIIVLGQRRFLLSEHGVYLPFAGPQMAPAGTWINNPDTISGFADPKLLEAAGRVQFADAITGLGDAEAAILISRTFLDLRMPGDVRKSRLLRLEDLRNNNVVFLGAPVGNPLLGSVRSSRTRRTNGERSENRRFASRCGPDLGAAGRGGGPQGHRPGWILDLWHIGRRPLLHGREALEGTPGVPGIRHSRKLSGVL